MTIPTPVRPTVPHFYRYQSCEHLDWLKVVMLEHELYFPSVRQLNDPTDGRPKLAPMTQHQLVEFLHKGARNPTLSSSAQAKRMATLSYNVSLHGPDQLLRKMSKVLNEHMEGYHVYSLSKRYDNLALWAKYAANHSGYCLEFANEGRVFETAVEVIYADAIPMDVTDREQVKGYCLYMKRQEWSNEEEIRVVVLPMYSNKVKIEPRWLTRLILGQKMSKDNQQTIREWASQRKPELSIVRAYVDELDQSLRLRDA